MPIEVKNLKFTYMPDTPFAVDAVKDVCLTIDDREFVGVIGRTGCGKSTLIQLMAGLIKPDAGQVLLNGEDIGGDGYDRKVLRKTVGVIFQYPEYQLFEETVERDVGFGPKKAGMSEAEISQNVDMALSLVGFVPDEIREASPFDLSGGQKRKVAIAGVLAAGPKILILDEPIAGLDPMARESFMELITRLNDSGVTIIMISHNMDGLSDFASRIIAMDGGRVVMDGTPRQVFADVERLAEMGLGVSEARQAAHMLAQRGWDIPNDIITVDALVDHITAYLGKGGGNA
jgi:energy-coupling factor transport system ATP-binding protein